MGVDLFLAFQVCLEDPSDPNEALNLADTGSEQIYINGSGIPYAHYSSSSGGTRYIP